ncbi:MAG TPA: hypothetical protein VNB59_06145 [Solirubrobacterales bacterium]|nr:hypothetical protein [Solirubrobacterales bacterium]
MRAARTVLAFACLLAAAVPLVGCGADSGSDDSTSGGPKPAESKPAPPAADFPSAKGRTLRQVIKAADGRAELVVSPAAMVFEVGPNRYPFGVFERDRGQVPDAKVALYLAKVPEPKRGARSKSGSRGAVAKVQAQALDQPAVGPFPASIESLAAKPAFRARTTAEDPDAATVVYSTQIDFPSRGEWRVGAILEEGGELKGTILPSAVVGEFKKIPRVGQRAPLIHTPTAEDVGGQLSKITTRVPADRQNEVDYADALGRKPIVLLFATPQFCQSRVCGPVVDVAEQARHEYGEKADFIHMEIYNENDPAKHVRPQVRSFHLPSEPWLFTIDRQGRIAAAVEGAFGLKLMHEAVDKAIAR